MTQWKRRLTLWWYGRNQQCRTYREEPSPIQIKGEWHVGFFTTYCQKSRGHFGGHTT